jgi:HAD superfamily hydrolase (TIGR01509 family)
MIDAVIFDMDGLLVDSEPLWQRARIETFGADRLRWTDADQQAIMGSSTRAWADFLAERLDHAYTPDDIIERVVSQMVTYYRTEVPLLPGARDIVATLRGRLPLGVASGSSHRLIEAVLGSAGWGDIFVEVLSGDDFKHGKPAPDIYLAILDRMGLQADRTVVFEDSANGILAGRAAGMHVFAVPSSYHRASDEVLAQATRVLDTLAAFQLDMLSEL